jgi:uncharacterized protein
VPEVRVLLFTGGHSFQREPFLAMFDDDHGLVVEHVEQPDAQHRLHPERMGDNDVLVFYDMPGLRFTRGDPPLDVTDPPPSMLAGFDALLERGIGMVFLHHSIASWPTWPGFADIVGGRFHYVPGRLWEREWPDSGYLLDVTHTIDVVAPEHPICAGLPASFELTDELYLIPPLAAGVTPLLRTRHPMTAEHFHSTTAAISGRHDDARWSHPAGPDLIGWTRTVGRSPVAYLQPGDSPACYADANYRLLVGNAIRWAAATAAGT